jgi:hypothetical protein
MHWALLLLAQPYVILLHPLLLLIRKT